MQKTVGSFMVVLSLILVAVLPARSPGAAPVSLSSAEEIVQVAAETTLARVEAFDNLAQFATAQFAFQVDRIAGRPRAYRAAERLLKRCEREIERERRDAERDVRALIADAWRALRRDNAAGGGTLNQLRALEDLRRVQLADEAAQALSDMYATVSGLAGAQAISRR